MDKRFIPAVVAAAKASQRAYGVPASVSLAQWALESAYGTAMPAGSNNPFGIKAHPGEPSVAAMTTEVIGGKSERMPQRFRLFTSQAEAFEAHARLFVEVGLYAPAMKAWRGGDLAGGVKLMAQHYATDPGYASKLLGIIAGNGLSGIDGEVAAEPTPIGHAALPETGDTPHPTATPAAARPPAPAAAAKARPAAEKAPSMPTPAHPAAKAASNTSSVDILAGAIDLVESTVSGLASSLKAATSTVTSGAVQAASNGNAIVGSISDGEAAISDVRKALGDARDGKWGSEPGDAIDFLKHVLAILARFGVNVPVVAAVVAALPEMPAVG